MHGGVKLPFEACSFSRRPNGNEGWRTGAVLMSKKKVTDNSNNVTAAIQPLMPLRPTLLGALLALVASNVKRETRVSKRIFET